MRPASITIAAFLLAAGCRGDFPNLNDGPQSAPPELTAARDQAPATAAALTAARDGMRTGAAPGKVEAVGPPARLLAALPAGRPIPRGVIQRAADEAKARGRVVQVYAIGEGGQATADAAAAMIRARGVVARVGLFEPSRPTPARIELYLVP